MIVRKILEEIITNRPAHLTLLDPSRQSAKRAEEVAAAATELGTDGFLIGGSSDVNQSNLSATIEAVKSVSDRPLIFFPGQDKAYSFHFDAMLFITMLNSKNPRFIVRSQAECAQLVKSLGVEVLPVAYLVVSPGMRVGEVGEADLIDRNDSWLACSYAVAAEILGLKYIYLECGSGSPVPVPAEMVREVKNAVDLPVIVGGGIRTSGVARQLIEAGADILVTGTIVERYEFKKRLSDIIAVVRK